VTLTILRLAIEAGQAIHVQRLDGKPVFSRIYCQGSIYTEVDEAAGTLMFQLPRGALLSLDPLTFVCEALFYPGSAGALRIFMPFSKVPFSPVPKDILTPPTFTVEYVGGGFVKAIINPFPDSLNVNISAALDVQRVADITCTCATPRARPLPTKIVWFFTVPLGDDGWTNECTFMLRLFASAAGGRTTVEIIYMMDEIPITINVPLPAIPDVLPSVARAAIQTLPGLGLAVEVDVDTTMTDDIAVSNVWGLTNTESNPLFLNDSKVFVNEQGTVSVIPTGPPPESRDTHRAFSLLPMRSVFPRLPVGDSFDLFLDKTTFPGPVSLPPLDARLLVDLPLAARPGQPFVVQVSYAAAALGEGDLVLQLDLGDVPMVSVDVCVVEDTEVEVDPASTVFTFPLPLIHAQPAGAGSVPLALPHLTARCYVTLSADEAALLARTGAAVSASVILAGSHIAAGSTVLPAPLLAPVPSVRASMVLRGGGLLAGAELKTAFYDLLHAAYAVKALPGSVVTRMLGQEIKSSAQGETLVLSVLYTAKLQEPTAVEAVSEHLVELAAPLVARGFTLDVAASTAEAVAVDATVAYACGGGSLCFSGDRCDWDSDCADGHCGEGNVCVSSNGGGSDWQLYAGLGGAALAVVLVAALLFYKFSRSRSPGHSKLLEDPRDVGMDDIPPTPASDRRETLP
jgi:hypothetical protein